MVGHSLKCKDLPPYKHWEKGISRHDYDAALSKYSKSSPFEDGFMLEYPCDVRFFSFFLVFCAHTYYRLDLVLVGIITVTRASGRIDLLVALVCCL